ncbi:hypothetical protein [Streptomyces sp. NPDC047976]|uniref:hypothetical protein n=1 Tax=Streptomyces sp. NPDC047976 TaxID=3155746 RepID=UPI00341826B0
MTTLDLVPGLITTRAEVAAVYGGSIYSGGIVVSDTAKKVFLYSDPTAGEEHGYTFDGRGEDDEYGPLYLYTGAGTAGDQYLTDRNKALLNHVQNQREVHLFVAHGNVPGKAEMRQRYIGQVVIDPIRPYEERIGPDKKGNPRRLFVFRLRPFEGVAMAWTANDSLKPATKTTLLTLPKKPKVPTQTKVKKKTTEKHKTAQTSATLTGGQLEVKRREGELVKAFEEHLEAAGHTVSTFQITVAGEPGVLLTDLYDETDHVLYEAKGLTTRANVRMAIGQLLDYRRHVPNVDTLRIAVLLPSEPTPDTKDILAAENIALVVQTAEGFDGFPPHDCEAALPKTAVL